MVILLFYQHYYFHVLFAQWVLGWARGVVGGEGSS